MEISLLNDLLRLEESTTSFLEMLSGKSMLVKILDQKEEWGRDECSIVRTTLLFFVSPDYPALYCVSRLNKGRLTDKEYSLLSNTTVPIGRLFPQLNAADVIRKVNITSELEYNQDIGIHMKVDHPVLHKKTYDYLVGKRKIGQIIEFFNEESLSRL